MSDVRRYLVADRFIEALTEAGLLPYGCTGVSIDARIGEPVLLRYEVIADERLLDVGERFEATEDVAEAGRAL